MSGLFESLLPAGLTAGAGVSLAGDMIESGQESAQRLNTMGTQVQSDMQFTPYSVRTSLGNTDVGADGSVSMDTGLASRGQNQYLRASLDAKNNAMQDTAQREMDVFDRMMAVQQPMLDRQRSNMEARAHARGRSGLAGNQYGGSGEQFAQSRAEAEARNSAMLGAMNQAQTEMMNQGQLAQGFGNLATQSYQSAFLPMQHQLQASQLGLQNADLAQTGQLSGANMLAQLALGGEQINVNSQKSASELYGNLFGAMAPAAANVGGIIDGAVEDAGGYWNALKGVFGIGD